MFACSHGRGPTLALHHDKSEGVFTDVRNIVQRPVSDDLASSIYWKIMASKDVNAVMAHRNETPPKTLQNRDF